MIVRTDGPEAGSLRPGPLRFVAAYLVENVHERPLQSDRDVTPFAPVQ